MACIEANDLKGQLEGLFSGIEVSADPLPSVENSLAPDESLAKAPGPAEAAEAARGAFSDRGWEELTGLLTPGRSGETHRVVMALATMLTLFLVGAIVGWVAGPRLWIGPPAAEARSLAAAPPPTSDSSPSTLDRASATGRSPLSSPTPSPTPTASPTGTPSPTSSPTATPSPTPLPAPRPLVVPSPFPTPEVMPAPVISTSLPIPTPVSPVPMAADAINILVLGSDQRADWSEWHTDAVHVVSIQTGRPAVSVISIPRDLYVYIPGFWMSRINFADFYGESYEQGESGPQLLRDTLLYNLGIEIDYMVRTNFDGLIGIVDTLGGVDIPVHCRLSDHWPYPDENGEYPILTLEPGMHHMDGETALWYARSRKTTSVFSRERRQQQVLQAIFYGVRDRGMLTRIPALWRDVQGMIVTDMGVPDILRLAELALRLEDQNIRYYNIGAAQVTPYTTPYGGSVFLPRWEEIEPIVAEAMAPIPEARLSRTFTTVEVWNGTPNEEWDLLAADRLIRVGFPPVIGEPDRQDYEQTELVVFSEYAKGTGVAYLQEVFDIPDDRVTYRPPDSSTYGFRLILGADYQTCPYTH